MKQVRRLMIVEDEENIRKGIRYIVENDIGGWEVSYDVESAIEALEMLKEHPVELIITDISMAQMNGISLIEEVHKLYPQIMTIIITGHASFSYAQAAIHLGVVDYILKPVSPEKLQEALTRAAQFLFVKALTPLSLSNTAREKLRKIEKDIGRAIVSKQSGIVQDALNSIAQLLNEESEMETDFRKNPPYEFYQLVFSRVMDGLQEEGYAITDKAGILRSLNQLTGFSALGQWDEWVELIASHIVNVFSESTNEVHQVIRSAVNYMNHHYRENITLKRMSTILNINANYLSDLFKREMGIGYLEYLTKLRITEAKRLLSDGQNHTIQEIALITGYTNERYFVDVFKKETGMTPSEYKRKFSIV